MYTYRLIFAGAVLLAGCVAQEGVRPKWTLHEIDFASIKAESTTKDDVEKLVGKPMLTMVFPKLAEEVWDYRYVHGVDTYVAEIHFDLRGRTKYYTTYKDKCGLGPVGCR